MANERVTENLIRDRLRDHGYGDLDGVSVYEQKSDNVEVTKLLKSASKSGKGGKGAPEFIIESKEAPDFIIIVECKASTAKHESIDHDKPVEYAVDGALHYAKHLSKSFNVIAIGASGQSLSSLKVSTFIWPKGESSYKPFTNTHGKKVKRILPYDDYIRLGSYDPQVTKNRHDDLMTFARDLHEFMRDHAKLTESEKPLLVSGTLIALRNKAFSKVFGDYEPEDLQQHWMRVIKEEIEKAKIPNSKKSRMVQPYSSIAVHPELGKSTPAYPRGVLYELIKRINDKVWPFISIYHDFDVVGQFYGEFLKYTGGDKKSLGIVLTPRHITELFALIANVSVVTKVQGEGAQEIVASKVLDTCAGTGGFLISAMQQMLRDATTEEEREYVKKNCLVGVEQQPNMYALAASNMILRGDGKANLYQGSCFDDDVTKAVKTHACNVGMLNPPYSQTDKNQHELVFLKHLLDCLVEGGTGIAIVPMSCAIAPHPMREELLQHHTLEAVMSMPEELFYPVGVITCIMVFTSGIPHKSSNKKTWFGYWRDDGFAKTKHKGRIDENHNWPSIRDRWVSHFRNREVKAGESIMQHVDHEDEWCAEAYMETDYSAIDRDDFEEAVKNYAVFRLLNSNIGGTDA